jgi:hypothetical protein
VARSYSSVSPLICALANFRRKKKALRAVLDKSMKMQNVSGQQKGIASFFPSIDGVVKYTISIVSPNKFIIKIDSIIYLIILFM